MKTLYRILILSLVLACAFASSGCYSWLFEESATNSGNTTPAQPVSNAYWLTAYRNAPIDEKNSILAECSVALVALERYHAIREDIDPNPFTLIEGYHNIQVDETGEIHQSVVLYYRCHTNYDNFTVYEYVICTFDKEKGDWKFTGSAFERSKHESDDENDFLIKFLINLTIESGIKLTNKQIQNLNYHISQFQKNTDYIYDCMEFIFPEDIDKSILRRQQTDE